MPPRSALPLLIALLASAPAAGLEIDRIRYPADSGVVIAAEHGVRGDGSDCTAAFNALLDEYGSNQRVIWLADGTYVVSDTVRLGKRMFVSLVGESRDGVVIRLKDRCPGFGDPAQPRRVLEGSIATSTAFSVNFVNLTIDTGQGNPGAIGLFYGANNQGSLRNSTIRSGDGSGVIGLDMRDLGVGPLLVQDVAVEGFDTGIAIAKASRCLERVTLTGQRALGIDAVGALLFMRHITYRGAGPFMRMADEPRRWRGVAAERLAGRNGLLTSVVLTDARLEGTGAATGGPAFVNVQAAWMRDVETVGFSRVIGANLGPSPSPAPGRIREWCSHPVTTLFDTPAESLRLPAEEPPPIRWEPDHARWANPERFRRTEDGEDDAPAIQRAIDSGASTVYLPHRMEPASKGKHLVRRNWRLLGTVEVRGAVERIVGCGATFTSPTGNDVPCFRIGATGPRAVVLQDLRGNFGDKLVIHARAPGRTVVLRQIAAAVIDQEGGDVHLVDVVAAAVRFADGRTWARQLNVEAGQPKLRNDGGMLWVLGFKSEQAGAVLDTVGGGTSELLGSFFYGGPGNIPMVRNRDSTVFVAGLAEQVSANNHPRGFITLVREDQGGASQLVNHLPEHGAISRGVGSVLPAYVGRAGASGGAKRLFMELDVPGDGTGRTPTVALPPGGAVDIGLRVQNGPARFAAEGLPAGLACDPASGRITGRLAAPTKEVITVRADGAHGTALLAFLLTIGVPELTSPDTLEVTLNEPVSVRLAISNGPGTFAMNLPKGLTCSPDGVISGTVVDVERVGTIETTVRVETKAGKYAFPFTVTVAEP